MAGPTDKICKVEAALEALDQRKHEIIRELSYISSKEEMLNIKLYEMLQIKEEILPQSSVDNVRTQKMENETDVDMHRTPPISTSKNSIVVDNEEHERSDEVHARPISYVAKFFMHPIESIVQNLMTISSPDTIERNGSISPQIVVSDTHSNSPIERNGSISSQTVVSNIHSNSPPIEKHYQVLSETPTYSVTNKTSYTVTASSSKHPGSVVDFRTGMSGHKALSSTRSVFSLSSSLKTSTLRMSEHTALSPMSKSRLRSLSYPVSFATVQRTRANSSEEITRPNFDPANYSSLINNGSNTVNRNNSDSICESRNDDL